MNQLIINETIFKRYKNTIYYLSRDGEVYSSYAKKIIKGNLRNIKGKYYRYIDVWNSEKGRQQHTLLHRMMYETWAAPLKEGEQVNHINDDSLDNRIENLYAGSQKENIEDCFQNNHRVGHIFYLTILDKEVNEVMTFCPAYKFIEYSGHSNKSGSLNKFFNKNWFKKRYEIIEFKSVNSLNEYKSVTTTEDECTLVG